MELVTTPSRARRSLAAGSTGRSRFRHGPCTSVALAWALVLAPRASRAEPTAAETEPSTAPSGPDDEVARAMAAYERGTQNYSRAQYEEALADFTEAASLYASPDFQYNIGLCYEKLGKYDEAIRAFSTYLRAKPSAEDRPNVEHRIQMLQQESERRKREAEEAEAARVAAASVEPEPQPAGQPEVKAEDAGEPSPSREGRSLILAGAALAGVGGAVALGGGIAFGVAARQRSEAVEAVLAGGNPDELSYAETRGLEREGKRFEAIQIGLAAGGAAVAVTGAVLLALGLRKRQAGQNRAQAWLGPDLGRSGAGLVLGGRF